MQGEKICVSELSATKHTYSNYHFCRGNSNRKKTRLGFIAKGSGTYIYLGKKLRVSEGDVVFIPENVYCFSEWYGTPEIEVIYVSCFMHYEQFRYEPQIIHCDGEFRDDLLKISSLLSLGNQEGDYINGLEAYSLYYKLLQKLLPQMQQSNISYNKTLQEAIEFITDNWNTDFSIGDVAKKCCISESGLYRLFQQELGQTPVRFQNFIKINVAIEYLEKQSYSIATISRLTGFHSENHFRKVFAGITGTTPLKYRKRK